MKTVQMISQLLALLIMSRNTSGIHFTESIFLRDGREGYCSNDLFCNGRAHTLCKDSPISIAGDFQQINMTDKLRRSFLDGHNALRSRIARKLNASNMRKMLWDLELELMAEKWVPSAHLYEMDPCTQLNRTAAKPYTLIIQNSIFLRRKYLLPNIENYVLKMWYMGGKDCRKTIESGLMFYDRISNYSILARTDVSRVGCAVGRFPDGIRVICNYFRFDGIENAAFKIGQPCSKCPRDMKFCDRNLFICTPTPSSAQQHAAKVIKRTHLEL